MAKVKREALIKSPSTLLFYAEQKTGKTMACIELKDAELWDCQEGAKAYEGFIETIRNYQDMVRCANENKNSRQFKVLVIDSVADILRLIAPRAFEKYKESLTGKDLTAAQAQEWYKNDKIDPITALGMLDYGKGDTIVFDTFVKFIDYIKTCYEKIIYIAHPQLRTANSNQQELQIKEIDLPKKVKEYLLRYSDQICIGMRKGNEFIMDFSQGQDLVKLGGRFDYLEGRKIVLSTKNGINYKTYWERIYPDLYDIPLSKVKEDIIKEQEEKADADKALAEMI